MYLLIPAAGGSSRAGRPKGLLPLRGEPLLAAQLRRDPARFRAVLVVMAPGPSPYEALIAASGPVPASSVVNPQPERGPFSSVQAGLAAALAAGATRIALLPLDVPVTEPFAWDKLLAALVGPVEAAVACDQGQPGHPVVLGAGLAERLLTVDPGSPEARLDWQLRSARTAWVELADPRVRLNLNTPADWAALRGRPAP